MSKITHPNNPSRPGNRIIKIKLPGKIVAVEGVDKHSNTITIEVPTINGPIFDREFIDHLNKLIGYDESHRIHDQIIDIIDDKIIHSLIKIV